MGLDALDPSAPRTTSEAINAWLMTSSLCNRTSGFQVKNLGAIKFSKAVIAQLLFTSRTSIMQILHSAIPRSVISIDFFLLNQYSDTRLKFALTTPTSLKLQKMKCRECTQLLRSRKREWANLSEEFGLRSLQYLVVLKSFVRNLDHSCCKTGHTSWKINALFTS